MPVLSGVVCGAEWQIYEDAITTDAIVTYITAKTMKDFTAMMQPKQRTIQVALHSG